MTLGENISKAVVTFFDSDTAIHFDNLLSESVNLTDSYNLNIPNYRLNYFYNTFPLLSLYLISSIDNANHAYRFLNMVDRWPEHNSLSMDDYPDKTTYIGLIEDVDIVDNIVDKLLSSSEQIFDDRFIALFEYSAAHISDEHKRTIGSVVDRFGLLFKMLSYEFTFHKYRNLIDFIYYNQAVYDYYKYQYSTGQMSKEAFDRECMHLDISEEAIDAYVWYEHGDFYDDMFHTGYTASEWKC